jgi:DNA-binding LacI/PurR family transcriptional regulator
MKELNLDSSFLFQGNGLDEKARECMPGILDSIMNSTTPLTAVYCENDTMAVALLNIMLERGMQAPDDLAIIGQDGVSIGRLLHPYVTTISQPKYELGYKSAEIIIEQIEKGGDCKKIILGPELVIGETA